MTTSGAASVNASISDLAQDFEQEQGSKSEQKILDVMKDSKARQDGLSVRPVKPEREEAKQNTVDSSTNASPLATSIQSDRLHNQLHKKGLHTEVASNDPMLDNMLVNLDQRITLATSLSVEQKMAPTFNNTGLENSSNAVKVSSNQPIASSQHIASSQTGLRPQQTGSQQRLQDLMKEFKSLLEEYQQQTLRLAKNFATISESKQVSKMPEDLQDLQDLQNSEDSDNLDLSKTGSVVIQQQDLDGYESGLAQLTQTLNTMESELEASLRKAEYHELSRKDLEAAHLEMLERLANTSETRCGSAHTPDLLLNGKHLDRVGKLCAQIAQTMGCSDDFINKIASSARLHDIGKLAIPDSILQKPDRLDPDEYATMKMHTIHGAEMLANNSSEIVQMAQRIALTHHENWDGTGYPYQLQREEIALEGRIAAVADVYDALISTRIYKEAWPKEKAIEQIKSRSGSKFDPTVVEAFLKIVT